MSLKEGEWERGKQGREIKRERGRQTKTEKETSQTQENSSNIQRSLPASLNELSKNYPTHVPKK